MKKLFFLFSILFLYGISIGQIPIPKYTRTFSSSNLTRGFYFQAPVNFVVTGVQVPDEKKHGLQNVAIYKMQSKPPAYSRSIKVTPVFFKAGVPSNVIIPCTVPIKAGEWFGVLGACGNSRMLHNSYGTPRFKSHVLGKPITLLRFLTQSNIVKNKGICNVSSEDSFNVSRVKVFVAGQGYGVPYGKGSGFGTISPCILSTELPPCIGFNAELDLLPRTSQNQGGVIFGSRAKANTPFPFGTVLIAMPFIWQAPIAGPIPVKGASVNIPIPNLQILLGAKLYFQGVVVVLPGFTLSNGVEWVFGL